MFKIIGADQKEYGPISVEQIRQWIIEGRLNAQSPAQRADGGEWRPLSGFEEFADLAPGGSAGRAATSSTAPAPFGSTPLAGASVSAQPPASIKLFGILNIVFGALRLACSPFSLVAIGLSARHTQQSMPTPVWVIFSLIVGIVIGALMLTSGIGLCQMKRWSRRLAIYVAFFACAFTLLGGVVALTRLSQVSGTPASYKFGTLFGAVAGMGFGLIYHILLIVFLSKPEAKRALGETSP